MLVAYAYYIHNTRADFNEYYTLIRTHTQTCVYDELKCIFLYIYTHTHIFMKTASHTTRYSVYAAGKDVSKLYFALSRYIISICAADCLVYGEHVLCSIIHTTITHTHTHTLRSTHTHTLLSVWVCALIYVYNRVVTTFYHAGPAICVYDAPDLGGSRS